MMAADKPTPLAISIVKDGGPELMVPPTLDLRRAWVLCGLSVLVDRVWEFFTSTTGH